MAITSRQATQDAVTLALDNLNRWQWERTTMKSTRCIRILGFFAATVVAVSGCGVPAERENVPHVPEWVDNPKAGCGVGISKYRSSRGMARDTAVTRARGDLAKQLETVMQQMVEDYEQSGETDGQNVSEELTTQVRRSLSSQLLVGVRPTRLKLVQDEYFAEVCVEPEAFAGMFERMDQLSAKQRRALSNRARGALQRMDTQLDKRK
jgi:hypothetical protein